MSLSDYQTLVPSYNRTKRKFMTLFDAVLGQAAAISDLHTNFPTEFSVQKAVGQQLDIIGAIVGVDRVLPFVPLTDGYTRIMSDDIYRMVIRGRVAANHWDGTLGSLTALLNDVFPDYRFQVRDNQDMSINVTVNLDPDADATFLLELLNAGLIFPMPSGVTVYFTIPIPITSSGINVKTGVYLSGQIIIDKGV